MEERLSVQELNHLYERLRLKSRTNCPGSVHRCATRGEA